ncbi:MAG: hypothetical protein A2840_00785 [Candidatus Buchananbacteria bacterium RIFCSPHIGHO2_01_FULL_47_11b]|uniref:Prepilin peptidase n=1 Tax=Candidatus Buchananbacteria bacterium RIFCSPHIGHO2_01_FULL_47_11b TaxID=1797537 RepID=A0A1G1Y2H5_9BACT|nr:MAG: hypothetical protein A2840_00785 [Candidatus Buchananbacteria bacterium RIFCSPHIGHO2_01_FULL_47_11b]
MTEVIVFIFGLIFGSFLNVVIYRLNVGSFGRSRSFCPDCNHQLSWWDNIPVVSFLLLAGRCRYCKKNISIQYPLVELGTALILVWLYTELGISQVFFLYAIFAFFLVVIFTYDLRYYLIADEVTIPAMIVAFVGNIFLGADPLSLVTGAVLGGGFFSVQYLVSSGRWIGGGDIRLGAVMGLMLGWQVTIIALFIGYVVGAAVGLTLIAVKKKKLGSQLPFGTFLSGATLIALIYGRNIYDWYISTLGF